MIDSSNVTPANWAALAELIRDNLRALRRIRRAARHRHHVVYRVGHEFHARKPRKAGLFTGSQIPIGVLRTDGRENLITAIEIAGAHIGGRPEVPEVSLYFQNRLFRANRTTKRSAEALSAFRSYNYPPLAEVGVNIATTSRPSCIRRRFRPSCASPRGWPTESRWSNSFRDWAKTSSGPCSRRPD